MKRIVTLLLALAMTAALAACGSTAGQTGGSQSSAPDISTPAPDQSQQTPPAQSDAPATSDVEDSAEGKVLVAYFSWSGNTETLANMIQEATGGDLFEIAPETPYTDNYNDLLDVAQGEQRENARPALAAAVDGWEDYDTIFVGYPNWWSDTPMVILSFLESYDCTGKTIIPFATSGGGGFGRGVDSITASAAGATVLEGLHVSGSRVDGAAEDVTAWIDGLGL